ncbi:hypothetical protein LCGC14_0759800 [marine sediment metagenome]|uniref:Uncharacterized protein n=1 Tax=marine sediment metagenome TaxID=412755 RepID=A0A0F9Q1K6_9ZZZZ
MQRFARWINQIAGLAPVTAIPVGLKDDGLVLHPAGTPLDKDWGTIFQDITDAREAWRKNPLARRIVGLTTSYIVGNGIRLQTAHKPLQRFIDDFWAANHIDQRLAEWSDELSRSGELFPVLFTNPISGMSTVRTVPACLIEAIDYDHQDYEKELRYRETQAIGENEKWWKSPLHPNLEPSDPIMLHYAVNRITGTIRGESDLAPILPWLRRYNRWLEDRVRLNAAVRSFLWIVHAPKRLHSELLERYRQPPTAGSVIIAETDTETWEAVAPNLNARDAEKDGRAIRWMIVAGGPGIALLDIGEGTDSNLATGKTMAEQRRRFLRRRQTYLADMLKDLIRQAWTQKAPRTAAATGEPDSLRARPSPEHNTDLATAADITAITPDISPEDNTDLATATASLTGALTELATLTGSGPAFRKVALRMFVKFAGETLTENQIDTILQEGQHDITRPPPDQRSPSDPTNNNHAEPAASQL